MIPTLFTFGYWGWGASTDKLISTVDRVERSRGFRSPLFVDLRLRRSVRAKGFSGEAFAQVAGRGRYLWMPGLGNRAIADGGRMRLAQPEDAAVLLHLVLEEAAQGRRIIAFCACELPVDCHRWLVATRVLRAATRQGVFLKVVEWPGTPPTRIVRKVDAATLRALRSDALSVSLPGHTGLHELTRGWCSVLHAQCGEESVSTVIGPSQPHSGGWRTPLVSYPFDAAAREWRQQANRFRKDLGYVARSTTGNKARR